MGDQIIDARTTHRRGLTLAALPLAFCLFLGSIATAGAQVKPTAPPPQIKASSAILVDAISGQVLYEKNADVPHPPASTTKIMTAILLLENTKPEDTITADTQCFDTEGSSLHLMPGESITAHDLLYALMLRSANDGCVAAAKRIAGSDAKFAEMMTSKAREIGTTHTIFRNPNGLNDPPNETTARDLALMARYALQYPAFADAVHTLKYRVARSMDRRDEWLENHSHRWLKHFPGADGIKTGWTVPAGHCFVGSATWNGWKLISVVLHSPDAFGETGQLMKWGFYHFHPVKLAARGDVAARVPVRNGREPSVEAAPRDPLQVVAPKGESPDVRLTPRLNELTAPVAAGAVVGTLDAEENGKVVASTPLVAVQGDEPVVTMSVGSTGMPGIYFALIGTVVIGYGTAVAKAARRRGRGLQALLRRPDRRG